MIQVVLEDDGGGDGVEPAALAGAARVAALRAHDRLGLPGRQALVPQLDRHAQDARGDPREVPRAPRLRPGRAVGVERQPDDQAGHAFAPRQLRQRVEHRRQAPPAVEDDDRAGQQAQLVAQRDANAAFAGVDAEHSTPGSSADKPAFGPGRSRPNVCRQTWPRVAAVDRHQQYRLSAAALEVRPTSRCWPESRSDERLPTEWPRDAATESPGPFMPFRPRSWAPPCYLGPWTVTSIRKARGAQVGVMTTFGGSASPLRRAR